jgi:protein phosphatase PTC7
MKIKNFMYTNIVKRVNTKNLGLLILTKNFTKNFSSGSVSSTNCNKNTSLNSNTSNKHDPSVPSQPQSESNTTSSKINTDIKYKFNFGFIKIPHYSKRDKGGEDALTTHDGMLAVADGVGGWNDVGVDPAKYSNELCTNIKREFLKSGHQNYGHLKKIFIEAVNQTRAIGSCTFVMCTLDLEKEYLHALNMGDSGYMLVRGKSSQNENLTSNKALNSILSKSSLTQTDNKNSKISDIFDIIARSEEQQHSFNFPYQVGSTGDDPNQSETFIHQFKENDILILATDGLWDNLYEYQILNILQRFYNPTNGKLQDPNIVAKQIGEYCERTSLDERWKSPFCMRSGGLYLGGKPDDITIIVAQIVRNEINPKF